MIAQKIRRCAESCLRGVEGCIPGEKSRWKRCFEVCLGIVLWVIIAFFVVEFGDWINGKW